ncbi:MAG: DUF4962 domain-containing protein, partial [Calditrichaeota bacterium]
KIIHPLYQRWYQELKKLAAAPLDVADLKNEPLSNRSETVKAAAFLYRLQNSPENLLKVVRFFSALPDAPRILNLEGGRANQGWGDFLQSATALSDLWVAYDLLYNQLDEQLRREVRKKMLTVTGQLADALIFTPTNNHVTVMAIAVLNTAIVDEYPEEVIPYTRQELWQIGLEYLSRALGLIAPDGGYAEGVYYGNFVTHHLAAFSIYFENATGIKLFRHPYLERLVNWLLANEKGSGTYSAFDDAFQVRFFYLPLIIPQSRLSREWYAHWQVLENYPAIRENLVEAITAFEPIASGIIAREDPIQFFPESGQVIFRDDGFRPRVFASFLSENEKWFANRHEHIDPFSFELSAFGKDLIIDAGYGRGTSDPDRSYFVSGYANNGILIDGLDTYRNPIWGDSLSSSMKHSFRTTRSAGTTFHHRRGDVDLSRKVFFVNQRFLIMVDEFESEAPHSVALNFNHLGELIQKSSFHLLLRNQDAELSLFNLSSATTPSTIIRDFGLFTPASRSAGAQSFRIEQTRQTEGYFGTLLYPHPGRDAPFLLTSRSIVGNGELLRLEEESQHLIDFAVNRGGQLQTDRWESDAHVLMIRYTPEMEFEQLLLVRFTHFTGDQLSFRSEIPVTLFLEKTDLGWQGYIETEHEFQPYVFSYEGIFSFPFKFNRIVIHPSLTHNSEKSYRLKGSGSVEIGTLLTPVLRPYRYHQAPPLIEWASKNVHPKTRYESWSPYQKQIFRNQIMSTVLDGFFMGFDNLQKGWFGGRRLLTNVGYTLQGIVEESYKSSSASTLDLRIPHRYDTNFRTGSSTWRIFEEGDISAEGISIRNLHLINQWASGMTVSYQGARWFKDHRRDRFAIHMPMGWGMEYQIARNLDDTEQQILTDVEGPFGIIQPGIRWSNRQDRNESFLTWRLKRFQGSIRRIQIGDSVMFHQWITLFNRA